MAHAVFAMRVSRACFKCFCRQCTKSGPNMNFFPKKREAKRLTREYTLFLQCLIWEEKIKFCFEVPQNNICVRQRAEMCQKNGHVAPKKRIEKEFFWKKLHRHHFSKKSTVLLLWKVFSATKQRVRSTTVRRCNPSGTRWRRAKELRRRAPCYFPDDPYCKIRPVLVCEADSVTQSLAKSWLVT